MEKNPRELVQIGDTVLLKDGNYGIVNNADDLIDLQLNPYYEFVRITRDNKIIYEDIYYVNDCVRAIDTIREFVTDAELKTFNKLINKKGK